MTAATLSPAFRSNILPERFKPQNDITGKHHKSAAPVLESSPQLIVFKRLPEHGAASLETKEGQLLASITTKSPENNKHGEYVLQDTQGERLSLMKPVHYTQEDVDRHRSRRYAAATKYKIFGTSPVHKHQKRLVIEGSTASHPLFNWATIENHSSWLGGPKFSMRLRDDDHSVFTTTGRSGSSGRLVSKIRSSGGGAVTVQVKGGKTCATITDTGSSSSSDATNATTREVEVQPKVDPCLMVCFLFIVDHMMAERH
jgi:hypothetical protein